MGSRTHLSAFIEVYNFAKRLKTLSGLTLYESLCKLRKKTAQRFKLNPIQHMPGLSIQRDGPVRWEGSEGCPQKGSQVP